MHDENHDLPDELPEHKEKIDSLVETDPEFARKYREYNQLNDKIYDIEEEHSPVSDDYLHDLKKQRLVLKDELYRMIKGF